MEATAKTECLHWNVNLSTAGLATQTIPVDLSLWNVDFTNPCYIWWPVCGGGGLKYPPVQPGDLIPSHLPVPGIEPWPTLVGGQTFSLSASREINEIHTVVSYTRSSEDVNAKTLMQERVQT